MISKEIKKEVQNRIFAYKMVIFAINGGMGPEELKYTLRKIIKNLEKALEE